MQTIIKLDNNLINQISAGEVVERPASVVKELVENSIDAKAKNIKIEIFEGGKKEIIISDNGIGLDKEDLDICLEKYTTSKIKSLQDLYNVLTFGFRGEALASISSISEMSITSKTKNSLNANTLEYSNEKGKIFTVSSHSEGTTISVKNLFYNTPARLNYLKQDRTEYSKILNYLENVALSYPQIGIEFISDGKKIFKYNQNEDLKTRIYAIYGDELSNHILEVNFEMVGIKITGYISDPKTSFINKNKQHIFVNKRPISSVIISKAINDAYNRFIPHSSFPAYILNLEIDPTIIDVNVHPRKQEIRFENEQNIFRAFYHAVLDNLEKVSLVNPSAFSRPLDNGDSISSSNFEKGAKSEGLERKSTGESINRGESIKNNIINEKYFTSSGTNFKEFSPYKNTAQNPNQYSLNSHLPIGRGVGGEGGEKRLQEGEISLDLHYTKLGKIIGQAFNSYIIVENEGKIVILDQHALAERVIYEKLLKLDKKNNSQKLLIPENIKLGSIEQEILLDNIDTFENMGFEIEILGNNIISLYSIPDFVKKEDLNNLFLGILGDLSNGNNKSKTLQEVKNKIFAYTACRSAIKFGNKLNLFEMNKLLNESLDSYSSTCPHGRPVIYEIGLDELKDKYER